MSQSSAAAAKPMTEDQFLSLQAEQAKASAARALSDAKMALINQLDPRPLARKHPILTLISATLAAFVATISAVPSKEQRELNRIERMNRAMNPPPPVTAGNGKSSAAKPGEHQTLGQTILHELLSMIKPILLATITASVKAATSASAQPSDSSPDKASPV